MLAFCFTHEEVGKVACLTVPLLAVIALSDLYFIFAEHSFHFDMFNIIVK